MSWLGKISSEEAKIWENLMLEHSFDYEDWGVARNHLKEILKKDDLSASEDSIRSYISCSAESVGSVHPLPELKDVVEEFYQKYGMENTKPFSE
jgi:hypothetical protein